MLEEFVSMNRSIPFHLSRHLKRRELRGDVMRFAVGLRVVGVAYAEQVDGKGVVLSLLGAREGSSCRAIASYLVCFLLFVVYFFSGEW